MAPLYGRCSYWSNLASEDKVNFVSALEISLITSLSTQTTASLIDSPLIDSPRLASVINCNTRHAGQIEYLRGLEPENLLPYLRGASSQASSSPLSAVRNP